MRRLLLAALLLTQAPAFSAQAPSSYLFSYLINNSEDGLHLAVERGRAPVVARERRAIVPVPGQVGSRLMRDPSIARGPDGMFHMVWTTGWWDKGIGVAHSKDLIEWSPQQFVPVMADRPDAQNCWAPEIFFDEDQGRFLIFWSTTMVRDARHGSIASTTSRRRTSGPIRRRRCLFDDGFSVIDAFIVKSAPGPLHAGVEGRDALPRRRRTCASPRRPARTGPTARPRRRFQSTGSGAVGAEGRLDCRGGPLDGLLRRVHAAEGTGRCNRRI